MRWASSFRSDRWGDGACKSLTEMLIHGRTGSQVQFHSSAEILWSSQYLHINLELDTEAIKWLMMSLNSSAVHIGSLRNPLFAHSTSVTLSQAFDPEWPWSGYQCQHQKCGIYSPVRFTDLLYTPTEMQSKMNTSIKNLCDFPLYDGEGRVDQRVGGQTGRRN